jgi:pyridoxamine 5'-phosphate oxidase family protein
MTFTEAECAYLVAQALGRLATVSAEGDVQNSPVGFSLNPDTGTIDIGGLAMASTRKFRNVHATGKVAFVVDDVVSVDPWTVRGVEIRGTGEALNGQTPSQPGLSPEIIRIHPRRVISWGIEPDVPGMSGRNIELPDRQLHPGAVAG